MIFTTGTTEVQEDADGTAELSPVMTGRPATVLPWRETVALAAEVSA